MNYRNKASRVVTEVQSGCVCGETMKWAVGTLMSLTTHSMVSPETHPLFTSVITLEALFL